MEFDDEYIKANAPSDAACASSPTSKKAKKYTWQPKAT